MMQIARTDGGTSRQPPKQTQVEAPMKSTHLSGLGITLTAGTLMLTAVPSLAQQAPKTAASNEDVIEEVVVTARRREENIQSVPIAVTAISGETLTRMGVSNAFDLASRAFPT
jgi:outer membrane receptor protein involved in Fe transport